MPFLIVVLKFAVTKTWIAMEEVVVGGGGDDDEC